MSGVFSYFFRHLRTASRISGIFAPKMAEPFMPLNSGLNLRFLEKKISFRVQGFDATRTSKTRLPVNGARGPGNAVVAIPPGAAAAGFAGKARQHFSSGAVQRAFGDSIGRRAPGATKNQLAWLYIPIIPPLPF